VFVIVLLIFFVTGGNDPSKRSDFGYGGKKIGPFPGLGQGLRKVSWKDKNLHSKKRIASGKKMITEKKTNRLKVEKGDLVVFHGADK